MVKVNPMYQVLMDLSKKRISYEKARARVRKILNRDINDTNWSQIIPIVLSARSAVIYNLKEEGLNLHEIDEKEFIDMIVDKIPLIKGN